jgi:PadR family transcriptional regulator, regulatory protein PadR
MPKEQSKAKDRGMRIGAVSLWIILLLSERPMYGYEIIRELEKRFSGYWRPKTGTIYPAMDRLENEQLVTSQREFRSNGPDRKHYALTKKGRDEVKLSMAHWIKMMEVFENYREMHEAIFRFKKDDATKVEISKLLSDLGNCLNIDDDDDNINIKEIFSTISKKANSDSIDSKEKIVMRPTDPISFKFLYAKENSKFELHMEIEWPAKND